MRRVHTVAISLPLLLATPGLASAQPGPPPPPGPNSEAPAEPSKQGIPAEDSLAVTNGSLETGAEATAGATDLVVSTTQATGDLITSSLTVGAQVVSTIGEAAP